MTRSALYVTAALTAATAILLTACGGSNAGDSDKIAGTSTTAPTATPSASPADAVKRPPTDLPKDLTMVFDWPKTGDATKDAVLNDSMQYLRAVKRASAGNDLRDPAYGFYSRDQALSYAHAQIKANIDGGWAPVGQDHYFRATVDAFKAGSATLSFCRDQSKVFSKKVTTGKVNRTGVDDSSYLLYNLLLVKDSVSKGVWQTTRITVLKAAQCKG